MLLEGEWFQPIEVDNFEQIQEKISRMDGNGRSYLYITDQVGNYIQTGGYGDSFTVEKRIYTNPVDYVHTKAGYPGDGASDIEKAVMIAGNCVKIRQNQVLPKTVVLQLFLDFFQGAADACPMEWVEMDI